MEYRERERKKVHENEVLESESLAIPGNQCALKEKANRQLGNAVIVSLCSDPVFWAQWEERFSGS